MKMHWDSETTRFAGGRSENLPGGIERAGGISKGAPFADYDDFADCENKNSDKSDPSAYCGEIKHRTEDKESRKTADLTDWEDKEWGSYDGATPGSTIYFLDFGPRGVMVVSDDPGYSGITWRVYRDQDAGRGADANGSANSVEEAQSAAEAAASGVSAARKAASTDQLCPLCGERGLVLDDRTGTGTCEDCGSTIDADGVEDLAHQGWSFSPGMGYFPRGSRRGNRTESSRGGTWFGSPSSSSQKDKLWRYTKPAKLREFTDDELEDLSDFAKAQLEMCPMDSIEVDAVLRGINSARKWKAKNGITSSRTASKRTSSMWDAIREPLHVVAGWDWDERLSGYVTDAASAHFSCVCGSNVEAPGYSTCTCGKIWNSYPIQANGATRVICREIPVRDLLLAGKHDVV